MLDNLDSDAVFREHELFSGDKFDIKGTSWFIPVSCSDSFSTLLSLVEFVKKDVFKDLRSGDVL